MRLCDFVDRDYRHQNLLSMETNVIAHCVCCLSKSVNVKSVMWASVLVMQYSPSNKSSKLKLDKTVL